MARSRRVCVAYAQDVVAAKVVVSKLLSRSHGEGAIELLSR
jgi:hypothetical protein